MLRDELEKKVENNLLDSDIENQQVLEEPADNTIENKSTDITGDIDLSIFSKKKFSINGDTSKVIELDLSDLSIINRIKDLYPTLENLQNKAGDLSIIDTTKSDKEELIDETATKLKDIDIQMRDCIDKIFDYPVCKVIAPTGSMYDPVRGKFKYEHIIETLLNLYGDNLNKEINKMKNKISKHTNKYVKKK